jgi:hypothetical protein
MSYYYIQEDDMSKKKIKDVCESCGRPKMDEAMNHFRAVQEAMQYIRINDNSPYMVEELPLYEGVKQ